MESYLISDRYDLVTPDGQITSISRVNDELYEATVSIKNISPAFVGFKIDRQLIFFNLKSTLAQLGVNGIHKEFYLDSINRTAEVKVELHAIGHLAKK